MYFVFLFFCLSGVGTKGWGGLRLRVRGVSACGGGGVCRRLDFLFSPLFFDQAKKSGEDFSLYIIGLIGLNLRPWVFYWSKKGDLKYLIISLEPLFKVSVSSEWRG